MSDLISRQAAIEAVNSLTYPSSLVDVKRKLADLPPAQPEHIKGRWKNKGKIRAWDVFGTETFGVKRECTNCGFVHIFIEDHGHYPYCPILPCRHGIGEVTE